MAIFEALYEQTLAGAATSPSLPPMHAVAQCNEWLWIAVDEQVKLVLNAKKGITVVKPVHGAAVRQPAQMANDTGDVAASAETFIAGTLQQHAGNCSVTRPRGELRQHQLAHLQIKRVQLSGTIQRGDTNTPAAGGRFGAEEDGAVRRGGHYGRQRSAGDGKLKRARIIHALSRGQATSSMACRRRAVQSALCQCCTTKSRPHRMAPFFSDQLKAFGDVNRPCRVQDVVGPQRHVLIAPPAVQTRCRRAPTVSPTPSPRAEGSTSTMRSLATRIVLLHHKGAASRC